MENKGRTAKQQARAERAHQEDIVLSKILCWMGGAALMEVLLFFVKKYYFNFLVTDAGINLAYAIGQALKVIPGVALILAVALFGWCLSRRKQGKSSLLLWALSAFLLALSVCAFFCYHFNPSAGDVLPYLIPLPAVLALIYYIFQWEFFSVSLICALGLGSVWVMLRSGRGTRSYVVLAVLAVLVAAAAVLFQLLQKGGGALTVKGKKIRLLSKQANYPLLYLTCAVALLTVVAALFLGAVAPASLFYAVLAAWLLIMAVYYIVKLM